MDSEHEWGELAGVTASTADNDSFQIGPVGFHDSREEHHLHLSPTYSASTVDEERKRMQTQDSLSQHPLDEIPVSEFVESEVKNVIAEVSSDFISGRFSLSQQPVSDEESTPRESGDGGNEQDNYHLLSGRYSQGSESGSSWQSSGTFHNGSNGEGNLHQLNVHAEAQHNTVGAGDTAEKHGNSAQGFKESKPLGNPDSDHGSQDEPPIKHPRLGDDEQANISVLPDVYLQASPPPDEPPQSHAGLEEDSVAFSHSKYPLSMISDSLVFSEQKPISQSTPYVVGIVDPIAQIQSPVKTVCTDIKRYAQGLTTKSTLNTASTTSGSSAGLQPLKADHGINFPAVTDQEKPVAKGIGTQKRVSWGVLSDNGGKGDQDGSPAPVEKNNTSCSDSGLSENPVTDSIFDAKPLASYIYYPAELRSGSVNTTDAPSKRSLSSQSSLSSSGSIGRKNLSSDTSEVSEVVRSAGVEYVSVEERDQLLSASSSSSHSSRNTDIENKRFGSREGQPLTPHTSGLPISQETITSVVSDQMTLPPSQKTLSQPLSQPHSQPFSQGLSQPSTVSTQSQDSLARRVEILLGEAEFVMEDPYEEGLNSARSTSAPSSSRSSIPVISPLGITCKLDVGGSEKNITNIGQGPTKNRPHPVIDVVSPPSTTSTIYDDLPNPTLGGSLGERGFHTLRPGSSRSDSSRDMKAEPGGKEMDRRRISPNLLPQYSQSDQNSDPLSVRVQNLLQGIEFSHGEAHSSPTSYGSLSQSVSLPLGSGISEDTTGPTDITKERKSVEKSNIDTIEGVPFDEPVSRQLVGLQRTNSMQSVQSTDSLSNRVQAILSNTKHLDDDADPLAFPLSQGSLTQVPLTQVLLSQEVLPKEVVDYDALEQELNDIQQQLQQSHQDEEDLYDKYIRPHMSPEEQSTQHEEEVTEKSKDSSQESSSGMMTGAPRSKKLLWDYGADLGYDEGDGRFLGTLKEVSIPDNQLPGSYASFTRTDPEGTSSMRADTKNMSKVVTAERPTTHNADIIERDKMAMQPDMFQKEDHYGSTDSLARRVGALLGAESPQKQVQQILLEVEEEEQQILSQTKTEVAQSYIQYPSDLKSTTPGNSEVREEWEESSEKSSSRSDTPTYSDTKQIPTQVPVYSLSRGGLGLSQQSLGPLSQQSDFTLTPVAAGPFTAFNTANTLLAAQLKKVEKQRFDKSLTQTPSQKVLYPSEALGVHASQTDLYEDENFLEKSPTDAEKFITERAAKAMIRQAFQAPFQLPMDIEHGIPQHEKSIDFRQMNRRDLDRRDLPSRHSSKSIVDNRSYIEYPADLRSKTPLAGRRSDLGHTEGKSVGSNAAVPAVDSAQIKRTGIVENQIMMDGVASDHRPHSDPLRETDLHRRSPEPKRHSAEVHIERSNIARGEEHSTDSRVLNQRPTRSLDFMRQKEDDAQSLVQTRGRVSRGKIAEQNDLPTRPYNPEDQIHDDRTRIKMSSPTSRNAAYPRNINTDSSVRNLRSGRSFADNGGGRCLPNVERHFDMVGRPGERDLLRTDHIRRSWSPTIDQQTRLTMGDFSRRSRSTSPALRPYRPHGSEVLYYVESGVEDSGLSVAHSETTLESTHTGSDDALGPSLPAHALGSRKDTAPKHVKGIYGNRVSPKSRSPSPGPTLGTIDEKKTVVTKGREKRTSRGAGRPTVPQDDHRWVDSRHGDSSRQDDTHQGGSRQRSGGHQEDMLDAGDYHRLPARSFIDYPSDLKSKTPSSDRGGPSVLPPDSKLQGRRTSSPVEGKDGGGRALFTPLLAEEESDADISRDVRMEDYMENQMAIQRNQPRGDSDVNKNKSALLHLQEALGSEGDTSDMPSNLQEMWQRFKKITSGEKQRGSQRKGDFSSLLKNPVQHMVKKLQAENERKEWRNGPVKDSIDPGIQGFKDTNHKHSVHGEVIKGEEEEAHREKQAQLGNRMRGDKPSSRKSPSRVDFLPEDKLVSVFNETDETIKSVPEDTTVDALSGKLVRGDVDEKLYRIYDPQRVDPKMLKLQMKINKQKQKFIRHQEREQKRREKIEKWERALKERDSPPQLNNDSVSSISTTSTMNGSTWSSDSSIMTSSSNDTREAMPTKYPTLTPVPESEQESYTPSPEPPNNKTALARKQKQTGVHKAEKPAIISQQQEAGSDSTTDTDHSVCGCKDAHARQRKKITVKEEKERQMVGKKEKPLKEQYGPQSAYIEFKKPVHAAPKAKTKGQLKDRKDPGEEKAASRKTVKKESTPLKVDCSTRDVGTIFPSPMLPSPPTKRQYRDGVSMVSAAVQTTPHVSGVPSEQKKRAEDLDIPNQRSFVNVYVGSPKTKQKSTVRPSKVFTPETPNESVKPDRPRHSPGLAWYIPMKETKPQKKPLQEKQLVQENRKPRSSQISRSKENQDPAQRDIGSKVDMYLSRKRDHLNVLNKGEIKKPSEKLTLQEAFALFKADAISRSRERQRRITLAAEERKVQEEHNKERLHLFADQRKKHANPEAHPYSEQLHHPKQRIMTRSEMREHSRKIYENLPEVVRKVEEKKRAEKYKTNRLRAQLFKQKVLNKVLQKKGPWLSNP